MSSDGNKVTAKAHNGMIDIQGVTIAKLNDAFKVQSLETFFDPMEMFRQIDPDNASSVAAAASASGCPVVGAQQQSSE